MKNMTSGSSKMTPKEKLEARITQLESQLIPIDRNAKDYWHNVTDSRIEFNSRVYQRLEEAKFLFEHLFINNEEK